MLPRRMLVLTVVPVLLLAAACSGGDDDASESKDTKASQAPLQGTNWVLTDGGPSGLSSGSSTATIRFARGTVSGSTGCNNYNGPYEVDGSDLTIGPNLATTQKACESPTGAEEQAYLRLLGRVASFTIDDTTLSFAATSGRELLVYRASVGADELEGSWVATSYYTGDAVQSVLIGSELTADFAGDTVSGISGCNNFSGPVEVTGDDIAIGPLASTLRACADPAVDTQERDYLAALELATTFRVTGDRLELFREDGGIAAMFDRA